MSKPTRTHFDKLRKAAGQYWGQKISEGELLTAPIFAKCLGISLRQLARLEGNGGVFAVAVDGTSYYPALLLSPLYNRRRLRRLCRIIFPAPASARWDYLTSRWGSLGDITPLDAMQTDVEYRRLLRAAKGWASEWWRTTVEIYGSSGGMADNTKASPVCTGTVEEDPRVSVWRRASAAMDGTNVRPHGSYPRLGAATVLVSKEAAGESEPLWELRLEVTVSGRAVHALVRTCDGTSTKLGPALIDDADDIVTVVRKLLATVPRG